MPLPIVAGIIGATGSQLLDYALGRPMNLWGQQIDAQQQGAHRGNQYLGNYARPNVLPPPDAIFEAARRGLISRADAQQLLAYQGVLWGWMPWQENRAARSAGLAAWFDAREPRRLLGNLYAQTWEQVAKMRRSRPDPATIMQLWARGRIDERQWDRLVDGLDWDPLLYTDAVFASYQQPGLTELQQLVRRGEITQDEYRMWAARLGWTDSLARLLADKVSILPNLGDLRAAQYRGLLTPEQTAKYAHALGWTDQTALRAVWESMRPIPGFGDLVSLAVREVWDEGVVQRWGYDAEFPYPLAAWARKQGWDWGEEIIAPDGTRYPRVAWPQAHWRAHWRPMALEHAYRAFNRFRGNRLYRYQDRYRDIKEFTHAHLNDVIKVADYPPAVRDWLAALAQPVLPIMSIRQLYRYGLRNREWARQNLLDRGYVAEDVEAILDLLGADEQIALRRQHLTAIRRLVTETIAETRLGYRMGGIDAQTATGRLATLGFGPQTAERMLALEDARAAREQLTQFIRQLRRSYLTGALSDQEALASLAAARIAPAAATRYLTLWRAELTSERRALSTGQVIAAVASQQLTPAEGEVRLARLGWTAPDAALLLQRAVAQLTRAQARAAQQAVNTAARQARALQAAQRQAQAAQRSAQNQLRRIYPVGTLRRQYCLGIRKGPTVYALLLSQGYTPDSASGLLLQWAHECEASPPAPDKRVGSLESYLRRQTPISLLKQWWSNGITTDSWTRQRLAAIGVEPGVVTATIQLWQGALGKKSGPAPEGTPPPGPLS